MKNIFRKSLILIAASVPLAYGGANFANSTIVEEVMGIEKASSSTRANDEYYADDDLVEYRIHSPSSPIYDGDNGIDFSFQVEIGDGGSVDEFPTSFNKFKIWIETSGTTYGASPLASLELDSSEFSTMFSTTATGSGTLASYQTTAPINLDTFHQEGSAGELQEGKKYQFRLEWNDKDLEGGTLPQYTSPTEFTYGVNVPTFTYVTYEGYEQAVVKLELGLAGDALTQWESGGLYFTDLFNEFKMTWGDNQNIDVISQMGADENKFHTKDFLLDKNLGDNSTVTMFFLFDNLEEDDPIKVNIDYEITSEQEVFNIDYFDGASAFETTFDSNTYTAPSIADIDEDAIEVYSFEDGDVNISGDQTEHGMYADVMVPVSIKWNDSNFPAFWMNPGQDYGNTAFTSETEYSQVISSVKINSISNSAGIVDPSTITVEDTSGEIDWNIDTEGTEIFSSDIHKDLNVYFDSLALNETYTVDFDINLVNPEMFNITDDTSFVSNSVTFKTPSAIDPFEISIDSIETPVAEDGSSINTPENWNEVDLTFSIDKPATWNAGWSMGISSMIQGGYVDIMTETEDEFGETVYDVVDTYTLTAADINAIGTGSTPVTIRIPNLDSGTLYSFQVNFYLTEDYERMFGFDAFDGVSEVVSSPISSGMTRSRIEVPSIIRDDTTHDNFDKDDAGEYVSNAYTYGFEINSPSSWTFLTDVADEESAFYVDNIIETIYISEVYSLIDPYADGYETLYATQYGLDEDKDGDDSVFVDGATHSATSVNNSGGPYTYGNKITVDGLTTGAYAGTLFVQLTDEASDAAKGFVNIEGNTIEKDISLNTGDPYAAPIITIDDATTQTQTTYNTHSLNVTGTIDITDLEIDASFGGDDKELFFEQEVLNDPEYPANLATTVTLNNLDDNTEESSITYNWTSFIDSLESDGTGIYTFSLDFTGLRGNTSYSVLLETSADYRVMEEVNDVTKSVDIVPNEGLDASNFTAEVFGWEFGSQNEITNKYDQVQVDFSMAPSTAAGSRADTSTDYYVDLAKNITSLEIRDAEDNLVAAADPSEILNLTPDNSLSVVLDGIEVDPKAEVSLSGYNLVVESDEFTDGTFTTSIKDISLSGDVITFGGISTPEVTELTLTPYRDSIKAEWTVSNMNNIAGAKIEIQHLTGPLAAVDSSWTTVDEEVYDATNFNVDNADAWTDSFTIGKEQFQALQQYRAVLTIDPSIDCVDTNQIVVKSETVTSANSNLDIEFDIVNGGTTTDYDAIQVQLEFSGNSQSVEDRANDLRIQVVDQYSEDKVEGEDADGNPILTQPIIYEETVNIHDRESGSYLLVIKTKDLIDGYELYSNQEYKLNIEFTTYVSAEDSYTDFVSITTALKAGEEGDSDLLTQNTKEKQNDFTDNFSYDVKQATENSVIVDYNYNNKHTSDEDFKNITEQNITIYSGETVGEDVVSSFTIDSTKTSDSQRIVIYNSAKYDGDMGIINDKDNIVIDSTTVYPNAKFLLTTNLTYDVYGQNSRVYEVEELYNSSVISVPYDDTFIATQSEFIDNDSVVVNVDLTDYTSFALSDSNFITFYILDSEGESVDFIYEGISVEGKLGFELTYADVKVLDTWLIDTEGNASFQIQFDGVSTKYQESITLKAQLYTEATDQTTYNGDGEVIVNNTPQTESAYVDSNSFYYLDRESTFTGWYYEIHVDSNYPIGNLKDVYISEVSNATTESDDITVVDDKDEQIRKLFEYDENNLYFVVDVDLISAEAEKDDLSFLIGRYLAIDDSNMSGTSKSITRMESAYSYFLIEEFAWPPLKWWQWILLIIEWFAIISLILLLLSIIIGSFWYLWRITFSNKRWYPVAERVANEKFKVFTDYIDEFGWTHKYQEYSELLEKNTGELREYALKMNIPITFDMSRSELLQTVSLLTDDEIQKFETFIENDVDIRNYEVLDNWKEERYKPRNPWIRYKLSKMVEKGVLTDDDDRLKSLHTELEYIKKEKETQAERENVFEEIKALVSEVLDTNIELTSEFAADPLAEFKRELEEKAAREEAEAQAAEDAEREAEEAKIRAEEEREAERQAKIAYRAQLRAEKESAENEKEVAVLKNELKTSYHRITKLLESYNEAAEAEAKNESEAEKVADSLYKQRASVERFIVEFKEKQDRIDELGGTQKRYPFDEIAKVNVTITASKEELYADKLNKMTKKAILDEAKAKKLEVKASWSKPQLVEDIVNQLKERGEF